MVTTLAGGLKPASVSFGELHRRYHPMLALVKELIGVVPNCDPILEIWPPAFRAYNLLVPNMFNLPHMLFKRKSFKASAGLAMYVSSSAAACPYCTAHTCSFALKRGASTKAILGERTSREESVAALAEGLSRIPVSLDPEAIRQVRTHFSPAETEWLALAVSMMGFLNKFMDAIGVELEQESVRDVGALLAQAGWSPGRHIQGKMQAAPFVPLQHDNLGTYFRVIRQAPGAISLERKWTKGVPDDYSGASHYLSEQVGYSFPLLKPVKQKRVLMALTTVLRDHLNAGTSVIGLESKTLTGYLFSAIIGNRELSGELLGYSAAVLPEMSPDVFYRLDDVAIMDMPVTAGEVSDFLVRLRDNLGITEQQAELILLSRAVAPSPAEINQAVTNAVLQHLSPEAVVELVSWISILQLLHRLNSYHKVSALVV